MKGHGKQEESSMTSKSGPGKFVTSKVKTAHNSVSQASVTVPPATNSVPPPIATTTAAQNIGNNGSKASTSTLDPSKTLLSDKDIQQELDRIFQILQNLKDKQTNVDCTPNGGVAKKIAAIQEALNSANKTTTINTNNNSNEIKVPPKRDELSLCQN